jgi:hypothetical protein
MSDRDRTDDIRHEGERSEHKAYAIDRSGFGRSRVFVFLCARAALAKSAPAGVGSPRRVSTPDCRVPMSVNGKRNRRPEPYTSGKDCPQQPGDEVVGEYSRERLLRMNDRFVERVEHAIRLGLEHPEPERVLR